MHSYLMYPSLVQASSPKPHPVNLLRHRHTYTRVSMPGPLSDEEEREPSIGGDHSDAQIVPHPGTSPAQASSTCSVRQLSPAFRGSFFKSLLRLHVAFRVAGIRLNFSPSVPCQHAIDSRWSYRMPHPLFQRRMNRWHNQYSTGFSLLNPWFKKLRFFLNRQILSSATTPATLRFCFPINLITNLLLHPNQCGHANAQHTRSLTIGYSADPRNKHTQTAAQLPGCLGFFHYLSRCVYDIVIEFCTSGHFLPAPPDSCQKSNEEQT